MKKLKNMFLLFMGIFMAATSLTSCLNNDDDFQGIDPQTYQQYMTYMSGTYTGKTRFFYGEQKGSGLVAVKYDSIQNNSWIVSTDSIVRQTNFPINKLDSAISVPATDNSTSANDMRSLRSAISQLGPVNLKAMYYIPRANFVTDTQIHFYVNPYVYETKLTYGSKEHTIYFVFTSNYYGGEWDKGSRKFEYSMYLEYICIDKLELNLNSIVPTQYMRPILITNLAN